MCRNLSNSFRLCYDFQFRLMSQKPPKFQPTGVHGVSRGASSFITHRQLLFRSGSILVRNAHFSQTSQFPVDKLKPWPTSFKWISCVFEESHYKSEMGWGCCFMFYVGYTFAVGEPSVSVNPVLWNIWCVSVTIDTYIIHTCIQPTVYLALKYTYRKRAKSPPPNSEVIDYAFCILHYYNLLKQLGF